MRALILPILASLTGCAPIVDELAPTGAPRPEKPTHHWRPRRRRPDPPFHTAVASFYGYGGATTGACGALQSNGVASRTLPCWTRLTMCAARCAVAVVDDRGPYVGGRDFDLSVGLAESIRFPMSAGVAPVRWRLAP